MLLVTLLDFAMRMESRADRHQGCGSSSHPGRARVQVRQSAQQQQQESEEEELRPSMGKVRVVLRCWSPSWRRTQSRDSCLAATRILINGEDRDTDYSHTRSTYKKKRARTIYSLKRTSNSSID